MLLTKVGLALTLLGRRITRAVQALDPAAKVSADIPAQAVTVEATASGQALREAIEAAGYPVKGSTQAAG